MGGNFLGLLDKVVRSDFCGSNFCGTGLITDRGWCNNFATWVHMIQFLLGSYYYYSRGTGLTFSVGSLQFFVYFLNHTMGDSVWQWTVGIEGTVDGTQISKESHVIFNHTLILAPATCWMKNFMGGKFYAWWVNHENNENWHPRK